jgi:hypothetical protein
MCDAGLGVRVATGAERCASIAVLQVWNCGIHLAAIIYSGQARADSVQKAFSVAKIEHPEVMDEHGKQKVGGLMDPKMGSMSTSSIHARLTMKERVLNNSHRSQL